MPLIDLNGLGHFKDKENAMIAEDFSASKAYAAGDYCYYNGTLYKFKTAHAAGAWTIADVEAAKLAHDVSDLKTAFNHIAGFASEFVYGGFSTSDLEFNDSTDFYHNTDFIPISNNVLKASPMPRFVVYYDKNFNFTEYSSNSINQTMVNRNAYVRLVPFAETFDNFIYEADKPVKEVSNLAVTNSGRLDAAETAIGAVVSESNFTFVGGGYDINTGDFDNNTSYKHNQYYIPIMQNVLSPLTGYRFALFYDKNLVKQYVCNSETEATISQTLVNTYAYVKYVFPNANVPDTIICDKTLKYAVDNVNEIIRDTVPKINTLDEYEPINYFSKSSDYEVGGFDTSTNTWNKSTQYYHSKDFIPIFDGVLAVNCTPRFVIFYDENKQQTEYCQNEVSYNMVVSSTNKYAKIVIFAADLNGIYVEADRIGGEQAKIIDTVNFNMAVSQYRYLAFTFGNQGKYGMFILGSNDLRRFNCLNINRPFVSKKNTGVRDPAVLFYDGYYWIVYTPDNGLAVGPYMGLARSKDLVVWEEFDNLVVNPTNGDDLSAGYTWAPDFFKEGNDIYIIVSSCTSTSSQDFKHRIMRFYPDTHSVGDAFTTNLSFIDAHIYKENGYYYALGAGGNLWKSDTLLSANWTKLPEESTGLHFEHYEAQFAIKKDDGKWRVFAQNVAGAIGNAYYYYQDSDGTTFESGFGDRVQLTYDEKTKADCAKKWSVTTGYFWHFTIYDRNQWLVNNNNNFM